MVKQTNWLESVSDMMSGLMMIFLFISVTYMLEATNEKQKAIGEKEKMQQIALQVEKTKVALYEELRKEFKDDLPKWQAEIDENNTVRFNEPRVLFDPGKATLKSGFQEILTDFFPRYVRIVKDPRFFSDIEEIRIEGHTSTDWEGVKDYQERYLNNARLSQERAFEVLRFCFTLQAIMTEREWLPRVLRANGVSFGKFLLKTNGDEDSDRSRRVEFRILSKTEEKIYKILEVSK